MCNTALSEREKRRKKATAKKIENLRSALKVIHTWASFDRYQGIRTDGHALNSEHVINICE